MNHPNETFIYVDTLEMLKVISDPLRLRIFQIVCDVSRRGIPCSVKQISDALGIAPAKLYYHIRLLENHNIIQVADTHLVSGILEKLYLPRGYSMLVSDELLNAGAENFYPVLSGVVKEVTEDLQVIMNTPPDQVYEKGKDLSLLFTLHRLPSRNIAEFEKRLTALLDELAAKPEEEEAPEYNFFYVLYPNRSQLNRKKPNE